jgi:hypothetical protein
MLAGGTRKGNPHIDDKLKPKKLSKQEREQLAAFIDSLQPEPAPFEKPTLP